MPSTAIASCADAIAAIMVREQGKPLAEAKGEAMAAADVIDWFGKEGRRAYGQIIPRACRVSRR
ncbi:aldehyde dehydrogenase family protein [Paracoccus sp. SSJ]|nr:MULTISPECIES: aldehyde dehydrogenase family protein [Paracoccus]MDK8871008.1 aldehyde dehydrogenase family protein [Paracoccus sp. SSJ]